jgi:imidazole glycerol-phosphate synthase subunit HisH
MIAILDYGVGNVGAVCNMFKRIGAQAFLATEPNEVLRSEKIVLAGVGNFDNALKRLDQSGLKDPLLERVAAGNYLLAICVGMQMLANGSEERTSLHRRPWPGAPYGLERG